MAQKHLHTQRLRSLLPAVGNRPDLKSENTGLPVELRMPAFAAIFGQQTRNKHGEFGDFFVVGE